MKIKFKVVSTEGTSNAKDISKVDMRLRRLVIEPVNADLPHDETLCGQEFVIEYVPKDK